MIGLTLLKSSNILVLYTHSTYCLNPVPIMKHSIVSQKKNHPKCGRISLKFYGKTVKSCHKLSIIVLSKMNEFISINKEYQIHLGNNENTKFFQLEFKEIYI